MKNKMKTFLGQFECLDIFFKKRAANFQVFFRENKCLKGKLIKFSNSNFRFETSYFSVFSTNLSGITFYNLKFFLIRSLLFTHHIRIREIVLVL